MIDLMQKQGESKISMKENAQRILSWLYPPGKAARWVRTTELLFIAPELTPGGLQSTLAFLQQKKRLLLEKVEGEQLASVTTHGMRALEDQIPVFSPARREWQGEWRGIFFLAAPKQDKNFRFLRRILLSNHALPMSRGMFLYPGELPDRVSFELRHSYEGSVLVTKLRDWSFGDEQQIIGSKFGLTDLAETYSSISKEIDGLLALDLPLNELTDQAKLRFFSVFSRLFSGLRLDYGLQHYYFSQVPNGVELLFNLQKLSYLA